MNTSMQKERFLRKEAGKIKRRCCRCKEWKSLDFFAPCYAKRGGPCKPCAAAYKREYRERNWERHQAVNIPYQKHYYQKNKEVLLYRRALRKSPQAVSCEP